MHSHMNYREMYAKITETKTTWEYCIYTILVFDDHQKYNDVIFIYQIFIKGN